jgi:hypothetical protein
MLPDWAADHGAFFICGCFAAAPPRRRALMNRRDGAGREVKQGRERARHAPDQPPPSAVTLGRATDFDVAGSCAECTSSHAGRVGRRPGRYPRVHHTAFARSDASTRKGAASKTDVVNLDATLSA